MEEIHQKHMNTDTYQLLLDGLTHLNFNSYLLYEKEVKQSINYHIQKSTDINNDNNDICITVKRTEFNTEGRKFVDINQRCTCEFRLAHLMMCRHEILLHKKFDVSKFDIMHHYRHSVTMSFNSGSNIDYNNNNSTILSDIYKEIDESTLGCSVDGINNNHLSNNVLQSNDNFNNNEEDNCESLFNFDESDVIDNTTTMFEISQQDSEDTADNNFEYLTPKNLQDINNEIYNNYQKSDDETKQSISSLLVMIRDFCKWNGHTDKCKLITDHPTKQNIQLKDIVKSYNMSFLSNRSTFDGSRIISTNKNKLKSRISKRLKPTHEVIRDAKCARKRKTADPKCSFCNMTGHKITSCPKLSEFSERYKIIKDNETYEYIDHLKQKIPLLDPDDTVEISTDSLSTYQKHHLIIHPEIYATIKSPTGIYPTLDLNQMMFTVSIVSCDNATILKDHFVVDGSDVESFIICNRKKNKNSYLMQQRQYKCTQINSEHVKSPFHNNNLHILNKVFNF